ncbi:hypothetical protein [Lutibacter sp.]
MKKIIFYVAVFTCTHLFSQKNNTDLKLYLNCEYCDEDYIKQNLDYVEFVRDQKYADVHLLFRTQENGSGGEIYEIDFIGQNNYNEIQDKLSFSTKVDDTRNEINELIIKYLKLGLVRYWVKAGMEDKILVTTTKVMPKGTEEKKVSDPWNRWVFNLGARGYFNGQESSKNRYINLSVTAKQVTEENKFYLRLSLSDNKSTYTFSGVDIISNQKSHSVSVYDVISINNHWSTGLFGAVGKSTFSNKDLYVSIKPALEYNFFSYEESSKKQLTIGYKIGAVNNNYIEKTIFNKTSELLWEHDLSLGGSFQQKWGNVTSEISYQSYLHDASLHAFSFYLGTNLRLFKGFSLDINGNYNITDNQVNLAGGDLTLEELLTAQQQVKSGYSYFFSVGLNYSFGSIYNTIVNPRFNF